MPADTPQARALGEAVAATGPRVRRQPDPAVLERLRTAAAALMEGAPHD